MAAVRTRIATYGWVLPALALGACGSGSTPPAPAGPAVTISLVHGGASAAELERDAVEPIEHAIGSLAGVRSIRATIEPGRARVVVSHEAARPLELAAAEVARALREVERSLPAALDPPVISLVDPDGPALWLELAGTAPRRMLSDLAREVIEPRLERLLGVGEVELDGAVARAIAIRPDPAKLAAYDVALSELAAAIGSASLELPAGRIASRTVAIRVTASHATLEDLGDIVVATREQAVIRVRDIATIEDTIEAGEAGAAGAPGDAGGPSGPLRIGVRLRQGADRRAVLASLRPAIAEIRALLPPGLALEEGAPPPGQRARPPLAVHLRGPDRATLQTIAAKLEADLRASDTASEIVRDPPPGPTELSITIDRARAAQLGLSTAALAAALRTVLGADPLGTLRDRGRAHPIVLRLDGDPAELLASVTVRAPGGGRIPLSAAATLTTTSSEHLLRLDREPAIELALSVSPGPPLAAARRRLAELARDLPRGYRATLSPSP